MSSVDGLRSVRNSEVRAARLLAGAYSLAVLEVEVPVPTGEELLIRVVGAGVCRSDVHVLDGEFADLVRRPVTMGHEVSGVVAAVGPLVRDLDVGTPVVVMVGWGCGYCRVCVRGNEQLCPNGVEAGSTADGAFAEFMLVPHRRHVVPLGEIDPISATPFGCAALCAYAAVKRVTPHLRAGGSLAVLGIGGLGLYAIHYARLLTGANVIAFDPKKSALELAEEAGATRTVPSGDVGLQQIEAEYGPQSQHAVIDLVGSTESLALAASLVAPQGIIALLGLAGGTLEYGFDALAPEVSLTTVVAGTLADLHDVVRLEQRDPLLIPMRTFTLNEVQSAIELLRLGRIVGRAVIQPSLEVLQLDGSSKPAGPRRRASPQ